MRERDVRRTGRGLIVGRRRAAALALAAVLLSGCGSGDPLPPLEAVATYEAVAEDLLAATTSVRAMSWERGGQEILEPGAEDCRYQAGIWQADGNLYPVPGQGMDWDPWREALDPVLEEHGFSSLGRARHSGAVTWLEADGEHGARVRLTAQGELRITDIRVDAEPCEDSALGL